MESLRANYENTISSDHPSSGGNSFFRCYSRIEFRKIAQHNEITLETNMTAGSSMANLTMGGNMTGAGNMTNESTSMMTNGS